MQETPMEWALLRLLRLLRGTGKSPATSASSAKVSRLRHEPGIDGRPGIDDTDNFAGRCEPGTIGPLHFDLAVSGRPVSADARVAASRHRQLVTLVFWPWPFFYHNRYSKSMAPPEQKPKPPHSYN
jgi:hypothetical protein